LTRSTLWVGWDVVERRTEEWFDIPNVWEGVRSLKWDGRWWWWIVRRRADVRGASWRDRLHGFAVCTKGQGEGRLSAREAKKDLSSVRRRRERHQHVASESWSAVNLGAWNEAEVDWKELKIQWIRRREWSVSFFTRRVERWSQEKEYGSQSLDGSRERRIPQTTTVIEDDLKAHPPSRSSWLDAETHHIWIPRWSGAERGGGERILVSGRTKCKHVETWNTTHLLYQTLNLELVRRRQQANQLSLSLKLPPSAGPVQPPPLTLLRGTTSSSFVAKVRCWLPSHAEDKDPLWAPCSCPHLYGRLIRLSVNLWVEAKRSDASNAFHKVSAKRKEKKKLGRPSLTRKLPRIRLLSVCRSKEESWVRKESTQRSVHLGLNGKEERETAIELPRRPDRFICPSFNATLLLVRYLVKQKVIDEGQAWGQGSRFGRESRRAQTISFLLTKTEPLWIREAEWVDVKVANDRLSFKANELEVAQGSKGNANKKRQIVME